MALESLEGLSRTGDVDWPDSAVDVLGAHLLDLLHPETDRLDETEISVHRDPVVCTRVLFQRKITMIHTGRCPGSVFLL